MGNCCRTVNKNCTCRCAPVPSENGEYDYVFRLGVLHIVIESIMVFILFLIFQYSVLVGLLVFFASLLSLVGASIAVCCCPTFIGWCYNVLLHSTAFMIRFLALIILIVAIGSTSKKYSGIFVVYLILLIIALCSGIPFWILSKRALKSMRVLPENITIELGGGPITPAVATTVVPGHNGGNMVGTNGKIVRLHYAML